MTRGRTPSAVDDEAALVPRAAEDRFQFARGAGRQACGRDRRAKALRRRGALRHVLSRLDDPADPIGQRAQRAWTLVSAVSIMGESFSCSIRSRILSAALLAIGPV